MNDDLNDLRLSRLIDGDLPPAEYRAFLAALDDEPGGWRRCALALLESQALGQELGVLRRSIGGPDISGRPIVPRTGPSSSLSMLSLLAIAASFLVAFGLGLVAPHFFSASWKDSVVAGNFKTQPDTTEQVATGTNDPQPRNIGSLQLVVDNGDGSETRQVPVFEVEQDANDFLTSTSPAMAPEIVDLLRRHGYDVQHQQEYLPADLDDGRQMIVPLDSYQFTPVSRRY